MVSSCEPTSEDQRTAGYGSINVVANLEAQNQPRRATTTPNVRSIHPMLAAGLVFVVLVSSSAVLFHDRTNLSMTQELLPLLGSSSSDKIEDDSKYNRPQYYHDQKVDHFDDSKHKHTKTFSHRYYASDKHFAGPGHPIFLVLGGEEPVLKLLYPFLHDHMAKIHKAFVLSPEHRFYGESQPLPKIKHNNDLIGLLTSEQAMQDILQLLTHVQTELGCSLDRNSPHYCPVITVGGSYPGFLAALLRIAHPDRIDIAYASSAPLKLYSQEADPNAYYDLVTRTAEQASVGCAGAVRTTYEDVVATILNSDSSFLEEAKKMNICVKHIPEYIQSKEVFAEELMMVAGDSFADFNMGFYPPTDPDTDMAKACAIFQNEALDNYEKMDHLFQLIELINGIERDKHCGFDLRKQLPAGKDATLSTSDWTGSGDGLEALSWEFQCCTELIVQADFSEQSMFIPREWSLEWLTEHCQTRFGIDPEPTHLVDEFGFDDLSQHSRILFTNGMNDGWSTSSFVESSNPDIVTINFPNGAHHSDLSGTFPNDADTEDLKQGYVQISDQIGIWLADIKTESSS